MKKLFYLFFAVIACTFAACSSDDEEPVTNNLSFAEGVKNEVIYKDEVSISKGLTFTAPAAWNAVVNDISKAKSRADQGDCDWLKLDKYYGEAGTFTLHLTIEPNTGETTRTAKIIIKCNGTEISMIVEQKNVTKEEEENGGEVIPEAKFISQISFFRDHNARKFNFTYDKEGRINKIIRAYADNKVSNIIDIIYSENSIKETDLDAETKEIAHITVLELNEKGYAINIKGEETYSGTKNNYIFEYTDDQLTTAIFKEFYEGNWTALDTTKLSWKDNKMIMHWGNTPMDDVKKEVTFTYGDTPCPTNFDLNSLLIDNIYGGYTTELFYDEPYRAQISSKTGKTIFGTPLGGNNGKMIQSILVKYTDTISGKVEESIYRFEYFMENDNIVEIKRIDHTEDVDAVSSIEIRYE